MSIIKSNKIVNEGFGAKVSNSKNSFLSVVSQVNIINSNTTAITEGKTILSDIEMSVNNVHDIARMFNVLIVDLASILHQAESLNVRKFND